MAQATATVRNEVGDWVTVAIGRNVEAIRAQGVRLIEVRLGREIRNELNGAVRSGLLGHVRQDGLRPEAYYHPDALHHAEYLRNREADYAAECIARVIVPAPTLSDLQGLTITLRD